MLTIPASIEALLKRDTARKNFRVQFPNNAARTDLTNEEIVQESVRFTESICSQDSFRFGLAERSVIEFETVGVTDMRGELIRCSCEIDTSNLTAAQLAEISGGSYVGELVLAADSDLGFGFYRIPYGDFVVAECPRNHELQEHRKVTAYSAGWDFQLPGINAAQFALPIPVAGVTCSVGLEPLALAVMCQNGDEAILEAGWTRAEASMTTNAVTGSGANYVETKNARGETLRFWISDAVTAYKINAGSIDAIQVDMVKLAAALSNLDAWLESLDVDLSIAATISRTGKTFEISSVQDLRNLIDSNGLFGSGINMSLHAHSLLPYLRSEVSLAGGVVSLRYPALDLKSSNGFSAYMHAMFFNADGQSIGNAYTNHPVVPLSAQIEVENVTTGTRSQFLFAPGAQLGEYAHAFGYTAPASWPFYEKRLQFSANGDVPGLSSFEGAFSAAKILNDYLELRGEFAAPSRFGGLRFVQLNGGDPVAIGPADYEEFWWDEYSTDSIGTIRFSLTEDDQDVTVDYDFGAGLGVYDMSSNEIFRSARFNLADATAMLDEFLVPALQSVKLSTIELSMEGRPDLEPGDALQVSDQSARSFGVYVMRRELSGIQVLHDEIEAVDSSNAGQGGQTYNSGTGQGVTPTDDWIVEQGTSGNWVWKKWRSGFAECEGIFTDTGKNYSAWGSGFYAMLGARTLPSGLFYSVKDYIAAAVGGNDCWIGSPLRSDSDLTTTRVPPVMALRFTTASNATVVASYRVIGRWKA